MHHMKPILALLLAAVSLQPALAARDPLPWRVPAKLPDALELSSPSAISLEGFLGFRTAEQRHQPVVAGR